MRFLLDQDVYAVAARFLSEAQRDVVLVSDIDMATAKDSNILKVAQE